MKRVRALLVVFILCLGLGASAQFMPPGFKMPSMWYNPALVMDPGVQKELHLSPAVASKVQGVMMEQAMKMMPAMAPMMKAGAGGKAPSEAETKKMMGPILEAYDKMQKACTDNMSPAQLRRLHEITLQAFGPKSLLDPKIGGEVGLTSSQTHQLQAEMGKLGAAQQAAAMKMMRGGQMGNPMAAQGMMSKTRQQSRSVLDSILTPKQKSKWKAMQGKPFQLSDMAAMMGGG